jgi:hypothetical protein
MVRSKRFSMFELALLWAFAALLLLAGSAGLFLGAGHGHWRLGLASIGVLRSTQLLRAAEDRSEFSPKIGSLE